jgi:hypothetical protein
MHGLTSTAPAYLRLLADRGPPYAKGRVSRAARMSLGTASPREVQAFLAEPHSPGPLAYADLSALQTQCMLPGLDRSTGRPI